jgi:sugar/nucleoside kinase (ribokinase family)
MSPNPQRDQEKALEQALALLREWGIDPFDVLASEIGESGYLTFRREEDGTRRVATNADGFALVDAHEWPKGFPVKEFLALVTKGLGH